MHSSSIAEWIVARFTDKQRAVSMVADLVELEPQKGPLWFWLSLIRVVISLAWRRSLAFIVAPYAGCGCWENWLQHCRTRICGTSLRELGECQVASNHFP